MPAYAVPAKRFSDISKRLKGQADARPPGNFSFGTQVLGGPRYTDAFNAQRAPSLTQLVENYSALIYAMVARNRNAVARLPMRLMMDGSRGQGGPPSKAADGIKVGREVGKALAEEGQISTAAIDKVYEIRTHPLLDALDNPDPYGTFASREQFIGTLVSFQDVIGAAYVVPEGNGWDWRKTEPGVMTSKGPPEFLWLLYPQYTIPIRQAANPIVQYFQYFQDKIPRDALLWIRHNHSLRDVYGSSFSPTYAGEAYRKQEQEQVAILSQLLASPRPNLLISSKDPMMPMGDKESEALEMDMQRKQAMGAAGGLYVVKTAVDVTPVSYQPVDLAGKEVGLQDMYTLACIFDQPPTYYTVDSNLANLQAADAQHDKMGVQPRCRTIAGAFTRLAKMFDPRLMFKFDPGLPDDELVKAQADKIYFDAGAFTINEWAEEKKYKPKPWGDAPWLNGSLKQPDMIMEAHEQSLEQADQEMMSGGIDDNIKVDGHEHQKKMDKAQMKADREERMLNEAEAILRTIKGELENRAS